MKRKRNVPRASRRKYLLLPGKAVELYVTAIPYCNSCWKEKIAIQNGIFGFP